MTSHCCFYQITLLHYTNHTPAPHSFLHSLLYRLLPLLYYLLSSTSSSDPCWSRHAHRGEGHGGRVRVMASKGRAGLPGPRIGIEACRKVHNHSYRLYVKCCVMPSPIFFSLVLSCTELPPSTPLSSSPPFPHFLSV